MSVAICKFSSSGGQPATHWWQENEFHKRAFSATALPTLRQLRNIDRLETDIGERLLVVIADDEAGGLFLDGPRGGKRPEGISTFAQGSLLLGQRWIDISEFPHSREVVPGGASSFLNLGPLNGRPYFFVNRIDMNVKGR
jgi:hypothetical protein